MGTLYDLRLGGIDATFATDQKGTNGSIAPQKTIDVLQALHAAAVAASDLAVVQTPLLIDAGASEGRALLYWACNVAQLEHVKQPIDLYGFELPHLSQYKLIHRVAETRASEVLSCPVNIRVVWKDCKDITSLSHEFDFLSGSVCVLYSFWTCWYAKDKVKLLELVAAEPKIAAIAVYLTSHDLPFEDQQIDNSFITQHLSKHSEESRWTLHTSFAGCRFIAGNETATASVFRRMTNAEQSTEASDQEPKLSQAKPAAPDRPVHCDGFQVLGLGPETQDGWLDMCNLCGGGGGG